MTMRLFTALCVALLFCGVFSDIAAAQDEPGVFGKQAKYKTATVEEVKRMADGWLEGLTTEPAVRDAIKALWEQELSHATGPKLLKRLTATFALADARSRELVDVCSGARETLKLPDFSWLSDKQTHPLLRDNLKLLYGRWLCQNRLYDESIAQLKDVDPEKVVDPASLLFYQSVAHHRLLHKKDGLKAIGRLLEDVADSPRRYVSVASLMHDDLMALKDASLDHVSRQMEDVERRLDLGRTGKKVRKKEDDIIAALDKMIEEEEKRQQQQQQQSGGQGQKQSTQPAPDSRILGGRGPGHVDRRNIGSRSGWGELPAKKQAEALQQVGKDFPPHYREVIQRYFRRLATEEAKR